MTAPQEPQRVAGPAPVALRCPRCGANVAPEQDWCLECGAPARTRLAPTPNWRAPIAALLAVVLVAGVALAFAFTSLTSDDGDIAATASTTAPVQPNETTPDTSVPTAPAATETSAASAAIPGSGG
jgi:hypothetical protein